MEQLLSKATVLRAIETKEQCLLFVSGAGGTGKTTLLKELRKLIAAKNPHAKILTVAPTAEIASSIEGVTIKSAFGIIENKSGQVDNNGRNVPKFRASLFAVIDWLIIDEISMVSQELFMEIEYAVRIIRKYNQQALRHNPKSATQPFAGANVLLFGDLLYIHPHEDRKLFEIDNDTVAHSISCLRANESLSLTRENNSANLLVANPVFCICNMRRARNPWRYFQFIELKKYYRSHFDTRLSAILTELRAGIKLKSWNQETASELQSRSIYSIENKSDRARFDPRKNNNVTAVHLFPTEKAARKYNKASAWSLRKACHTISQFVLISKSADKSCFLRRENENNDVTDICGKSSKRLKLLKHICNSPESRKLLGVEQSLTLIVGGCVMLNITIDINRGLVKGRIGRVTQVYPCVKVCFDTHCDAICNSVIEKQEVKQQQLQPSFYEQNSVTIDRVQVNATVLNGTALISRTQFPLINGPAFPIEMFRGVTLSRPVIVHFNQNNDSYFLYAALSRVQSLKDVAIAQKHVSRVTDNFHHHDVVHEYKRLRDNELRFPKHLPSKIYY